MKQKIVCPLKYLLVSVIVLITTFNCQAQVSDTSLQGFCPYKFGASISANLLRYNATYRGLVAREYSSITPENALKFSTIHPAQNTYSWTDADTIISFAKQYNKRLHGHTLIWHNSVPDWVTNFVGDSVAWENLLKSHIQTVIGRYKGIFTSWDVVNEAVNDDGTLRASIWQQHLGNNYIARAFQYAHAADPDALLFYNDDNQESGINNFAKLITIQNMVNNMVANGIPINGVGLQMHVNKNTSNVNIKRVIDSMLTTGLLIHISELDVAVNPENNQSLTFNATVAAQQFSKFKFFTRLVKSIPTNIFYGITTWDVSDADSWIPTTYSRPDFPLPFNTNYLKKSSFQALKDGATSTWSMSSANGQSLAGTYTDLGTNGTAISTNFLGSAITYDNDNSSVQDIGFNFLFNGSTYTQFVLNTNGFIKLGASAPVSSTIFYPTIVGDTGSVITTADIDLIYPYNHDLKTGSGIPEYRIYTTGTVGSRICTIQFKNLADKIEPIQYSNIEFQIKLYETSNAIEFIYGQWIASANVGASNTAAIGIKGITASESVNVAKGAGVPWNATLNSANNIFFKDGNYTTSGTQFVTRNNVLPDAGRTFHFSTSAVLLPVTLLNFTAIAKEHSVLLQWATTNEINNKSFEIQRSFNAVDFYTIGIIETKGMNADINNYNFNDFDIASFNTIYYRLKQNDTDGKANYSVIVKVALNNNVPFKVTVTNPFKSTIDVQLQSATAQLLAIQLLNTNGRLLYSKQVIAQVGINSLSLLSNTLAPSIYYLKVTSSTDTKVIKILKQ